MMLHSDTRVTWPQTAVSPPTVTIIIVNYNGRSTLGPCLTSVYQTVEPGTQILLIDNQSTDDSVAFVEQQYPQVRIVRNAQNNGYAGGNNLGAKLATGEFLIVLNPDTVVSPGWLTALLRPCAQDASVGMTTPRLLLLDNPHRLNAAGNDVHISGLTLCRGMGEPEDAYEETAVVSAVSGAAFAIRRALFQQLGGFDEQFFMYMEDTDLSLRAQLAGYRCLYVPDARVYHDYQLTIGPRKLYFQERNRYLMLLKNGRWPTLLLMTPVLWLAELISWGFVLLQDRANWRNKLAAYAYLLRHARAIGEARRQVQAQRRCSDAVWLRRTVGRLAFEQASGGIAGRLADRLFNPLFMVWRWLLLEVVR